MELFQLKNPFQNHDFFALAIQTILYNSLFVTATMRQLHLFARKVY